jgi:hypothetical protein
MERAELKALYESMVEADARATEAYRIKREDKSFDADLAYQMAFDIYAKAKRAYDDAVREFVNQAGAA